MCPTSAHKVASPSPALRCAKFPVQAAPCHRRRPQKSTRALGPKRHTKYRRHAATHTHAHTCTA